MNIHEQLKSTSEFMSDYITSLMGAGVHNSRVERISTRIANSLGFDLEMTTLQKSVIITLRTPDGTHTYTQARSVKPRPISFALNSDLSALSWEAYDQHLSLDELKIKFQEIVNRPGWNPYLVLFFVSLANMAFCRLFGGDFVAMAFVFIATAIGYFVKIILLKRKMFHYFVWFLSALTASLITAIAVHFHLGDTPNIALSTSVLYLVPGVPLIHGFIDIFEGNVLAGTVRLTNASLLVLSLALGLLCSIILVGGQIL